MRKFYLIIALCFVSVSNIFAQVIEVTPVQQPIYLATYGDYIYFTTNNEQLMRFDLTDSSAVDTLASSGHWSLSLVGDTLYSLSQNGQFHKTDLTNATPSPVLVETLSPFSQNSIIVVGTDLYIGAGDITKYDMNNMSAGGTTISTTSPSATGLYHDNGFIYFGTGTNGRVKRVNITDAAFPVETISSGNGIVFGIHKLGDDLYVGDLNARLLLVDLTQPFPVTSTVVTNDIAGIYGIDFDGNDLYIADVIGNKIVKYNLFPVSTNEIKKATTWSVFPNPTQEFIQFEGLENVQNYQIIDALGRTVKQGTIQPNEQISVASLPNGMYFIRLENNEIQQFIKQ